MNAQITPSDEMEATKRKMIYRLSGRLHNLAQVAVANACIEDERARWMASRDTARNIQGEAASILEIVFGHSGFVAAKEMNDSRTTRNYERNDNTQRGRRGYPARVGKRGL